ncbi:MAG: hypothetical protein U0T82_08185 [Bacteroidales bacterium]
MKKTILVLALLGLTLLNISAQKPYHVSSGEMIFSSGTFENAISQRISSSVRFTFFPHLGNYWHFDLTKNLGFFSGFSLRNIGMITYEDYDYENRSYTDIKTKRRSLSLGVPLALKLGSFSDHYFLYLGGQYEWMFHYKEKHFVDNKKIKSAEWFSDKVQPFIPSVFAGIQFPKGINLRFTHMAGDFLSQNEIPGIKRSGIYYFSLSFQMKTGEIRKKIKEEESGDYALIN